MTGNHSRNGLWVEHMGEAGEVLVLIHGLGANGAVWDPLLALAAREWPGRIVIPDLRGHGRSKHDENYSFGTLSSDIAELLGATDKVSIIGHSLGGVLGAFLGTGWFGIDVELVLALSVKMKWSKEEIDKGRSVARNPVKWLSTRNEALDRYMKVSGLAGIGPDMSRSANAGIVEHKGRYRLAIDQGIFGSAALGVGAIMNTIACGLTLATGANDSVAPASDILAAGFDPIVIDKAGHNAHVTAADEVWALFSAARRKRSAMGQ